MASSKTPADVLEKIRADVGRAMRDPVVIKRINDIKSSPVGNTAEEFRQVIKDDLEIFRRVIARREVAAQWAVSYRTRNAAYRRPYRPSCSPDERSDIRDNRSRMSRPRRPLVRATGPIMGQLMMSDVHHEKNSYSPEK